MKAIAISTPKELSYVPATVAFFFFWFFSFISWSVGV